MNDLDFVPVSAKIGSTQSVDCHGPDDYAVH